MAKLTVKNVGPIREAALEVKKHTVFIGPQGSGKSTLAKLIAIVGDYDVLPFSPSSNKNIIIEKYGLQSYFIEKSNFSFIDDKYTITYNSGQLNDILFHHDLNEDFIDNYINSDIHQLEDDVNKIAQSVGVDLDNYHKIANLIGQLNSLKQKHSDDAFNQIIGYTSIYTPAERTLISILSEAIWSLAYSKINLPRSFVSFARTYEQVRNSIQKLAIPFLNINYQNVQGIDKIVKNDSSPVNLSQSASGYQSIIPLLLVVEHQRQQSQRRFIIEEPELNLYPTAQKDLIYSLMGGLQPDVEYQDAEWVITTHSPYVLSSFNTLMLAYKVAQRSDELRAEVEKIIPSRCWINPDEFAAYYVDNGTVRSIISEKTGLIADNELDDVSENLAGEQDQLFELNRSVPRA